MTDDVSDAAADEVVRAATRELVAAPVDEPQGLVESVMRSVAAELRPSRRLRIDDGTGVTETAVASALRIVLDGDPAVIARRVRVEPAGAALRIWLSVAVSYEHFTRHGDDLVRRRVIDAARDLFDLHVTEVDLDVVDVFDVRPGSAR